MFWRFEVEGVEDEFASMKKNVTEDLSNYMDNAKEFSNRISKVQKKL